MDEKLIFRIQMLGALLICASYFLPWSSVLTPLGSISVRGLYVDFAWIIMLLAIGFILIQFAKTNAVGLGLSVEGVSQLERPAKWSPLAILAFFAWYGVHFAVTGFSAQAAARAGLDYGFWVGIVGSTLLIIGTGLINREIRKVGLYSAAAIVVAGGLAIGLTQFEWGVGHESVDPPMAANPSPNGSVAANDPTASFDASAYVTVGNVHGVVQAKDIEASRYRDAILVSVTTKNVGQKTIVGIQGRITLVDGFGKEVYGFNFRDDDKTEPGAESSGSYKFEGNQFEDDDPYHKMLPLISGGTAKYRTEIFRIAYEDGSTIPK